jgi:hypothetical protein
MRKLSLALAAAIILGGVLPAATQTPDTNKAGSLIQIEYRDTYGHWQRCADVAGMCGVTAG